MSEEKKDQKTDSESVELGSVLQLHPHKPTTKVNTVDRKDGEEYISLDDVYEVTGQESLQILAANCREFMNNKRLAPSGYTVLLLAGNESMIPGYDRYNAVKGGEGFLEALKKGFVIIIKNAKRFIIAVIDWGVARLRALLAFEKTEKELAIIASVSKEVKTKLLGILSELADGEKVPFDTAELYAALPGNITSTDAFSIVRGGINKGITAQMKNFQSVVKDLDAASQLMIRAGMDAKNSRSRYQMAVRKLRQAFRDRESFSAADVTEFRHAIDKELVEALNPEPMRDMLDKIITRVYDIDLGNIGLDGAFKDNLRKQREELTKTVQVKVTPEEYEEYRGIASNLAVTMLKQSSDRFDANQLAVLKDALEVKDAELIEEIQNAFPEHGVLSTSYTAYAAHISEYVSTMEYLVNVCGNVRRSIASIINWGNKVDRLMFSYITKDISTILAAEDELLSKEKVDDLAAKDKDGKRVDSILNIDYDATFIAKHPVYGRAIQAYRFETSKLRQKFKMIDEVNKLLKSIGARTI
ncbi:putative virion structural protein [Pseudomonas phage OBP]|uniref:virion structural protein n=1 Tax=Pseudomonas phage OBP TaxID=1124849 RepID=UPI000240D494|nr:virion structural protein [Pseudomonas phage OBP]AEV89539.1 putative virion structural protein [Pseudomonas phage OBP]